MEKEKNISTSVVKKFFVCYNESMKEEFCTEKYINLIQNERSEQFERFRALLIEYNSRFNLTSLTEEKEILYKHFLDSVSGEQFFPAGARVADVGAGAGFPSLPLKIVRPDLKFSLFESTGKKCEFLKKAAAELSLSDVTVQNMRAEDAGRDLAFREQFDVCCARAVARLNTLAEYCLPLVKKGGRFVAYKGQAEEELKEAASAIKLLGGEVEDVLRFFLPEDMGERAVIVIKKVAATPKQYPRGQGKERSKPL